MSLSYIQNTFFCSSEEWCFYWISGNNLPPSHDDDPVGWNEINRQLRITENNKNNGWTFVTCLSFKISKNIFTYNIFIKVKLINYVYVIPLNKVTKSCLQSTVNQKSGSAKVFWLFSPPDIIKHKKTGFIIDSTFLSFHLILLNLIPEVFKTSCISHIYNS